MLDDAALRRVHARLPPSGAHIGDELWERFACDELSPDERNRITDHVVSCAACAKAFRAVSALAAEARALDASLPSPALAAMPAVKPRARWRWPWALAPLAAAAAFALFFLLRPAPIDTLRGVPEGGLPLSSVTATRVTWNELAGADSYRVRVFSGDGKPVWSSAPASQTSAEWPGAGPGAYYWSVEALHDGEVIARSKLAAFTLPR